MSIKIKIEDENKTCGEFTLAGYNKLDFLSGKTMECKFTYDPKNKYIPHFEIKAEGED